MERRTFAGLTVGVGLLVGVLATLLFYGKQFGLSVPIFVGIVSALMLVLSRPAGRQLNRRNLWPLIPMMFFAVMTALRDDWMILWLNLGAILALGALLLHYVSLPRALDTDSFVEQTGSVIQTGFLVLPYAIGEGGEAWSWLREARHSRGGQFAKAVRGLAFATPVIFVFAILLGSADAVFASYISKAWTSVTHLLGIQYLGETFGQLGVTLVFGTLMTGAVGYSLMRKINLPAELTDEEGNPISAPQTDEKRKPGFKLSTIESGIILGSVALLFAVFVVIQFTYFFGGRSNITVEGLTYAQYARRGFFELVAVSTMTLGLAMFLDRVTLRHEQREKLIFRAVAVVLVALTTVLLTSAAQRMWLYEEAYGFTQLRVYTHVAIGWLGVMFGVFVLALFRVRKNVFSLGTVLVLIGYLVSLNLMNVDYYMAERNVARYRDGQKLDFAFLNILSADAVPVILPLYQEAEPGSQIHDWAGQWLAREANILTDQENSNGATIFSWNAGREQAFMQLNTSQLALPAYDASLWQGSRWSSYDAEYQDYRNAWEDGLTVTPTR
ncbi:MAG: DUF4173 domain-containing protein [Chloroflexota bacterium]